MIKNTTTV